MNSYKLLPLKDNLSLNEKSSIISLDKDALPKGGIVNITNDLGEVIFEGIHNKITLAGAGFLARSMFDLPGTEVTPSYNNALSLDNTINTTVPGDTYKTCLFCVGVDGCGRENSAVVEEDYKHWINEDHIVPFQYRPQTKDLSDSERNSTYMGRKTIGNTFFAYYFKTFDAAPVLNQYLEDGTPIDGTIYKSTSLLPAYTVVNMQMSITTSDIRDYFIATTGINDARINSISLCLGWKKTISGHPVYQDIRPMTRLNFPNETLIDLRKGIHIDYSVYF